MVKGLDIFREYFKDYTDQYVLRAETGLARSAQGQSVY